MTERPIPPWQDMRTLCENICACPSTVDNWVAQGILPPPRKRGGKLMWKWVEVDEWLTEGKKTEDLAEQIRKSTRGALVEHRR